MRAQKSKPDAHKFQYRFYFKTVILYMIEVVPPGKRVVGFILTTHQIFRFSNASSIALKITWVGLIVDTFCFVGEA